MKICHMNQLSILVIIRLWHTWLIFPTRCYIFLECASTLDGLNSCCMSFLHVLCSARHMKMTKFEHTKINIDHCKYRTKFQMSQIYFQINFKYWRSISTNRFSEPENQPWKKIRTFEEDDAKYLRNLNSEYIW